MAAKEKVTPAREVLDRHVRLWERFAYPSGALVEYYAAVAGQPGGRGRTALLPLRQGGHPYGKEATDPNIARQFIADRARDLSGARTYQVTSSMVDLTETLARNFKGAAMGLQQSVTFCHRRLRSVGVVAAARVPGEG